MVRLKPVMVVLALLACALSSSAQNYTPFSRACVVCSGEVRPGFTAQYQYEGNWYVVGFCSTPCRGKFIQSPAMYMGPALEAARAGLQKKDKKVAADATGPCDVKRIVKAPWCKDCDRELAKDDLLPSRICKKCEKKPVQIEYCVKMGESEDRSRISYKCETCAATSEIDSEFKHEADCKAKIGSALKKVCSKSGMAPHATVAK